MGSFTRLHRNTHTKQPRLGSLILHQLTQPEASSKSVLRLMGGPLAKDFRKGGSPTMTENVHGGGLRPMSVFRDGGVCNGAGQNWRGEQKTTGSLATLGRAEGTGLHSSVLSHHCARWTIFLALFPA